MKLLIFKILIIFLFYLSTVQANQTQVKNRTSLSKTSSTVTELVSKFQVTLKRVVQSLIHSFDNQKYGHFIQDFLSMISNQDFATSLVYLTTYAFSVLGFTLYWFPQLRSSEYWQVTQIEKLGRFARNIDEMSTNVNKAIDQYSNANFKICAKMALCNLGKSKQHKRIPRSPALETINTVLNLPGFNEMIIQNKEYRESHIYGLGGGDCDAINVKGSCPFNSETWIFILSRLTKFI